MFKPIAQYLDRMAIKAACGTVRCGFARPGQAKLAAAILNNPSFLHPEFSPGNDLQFAPDGVQFQLKSSLSLPFAETNLIHGKFYPAGDDWRSKPVALMIHGWNGEDQYIKLFGWYAKNLRKRGLNAAAIELPFHYHRKPSDAQKVRNFISDDLCTMLNLTQQSLADIGTIISWFKNQGCPTAGLWGFSLGAWLAGLFVCSNRVADAIVLATPVPSLNEAIQNLAFCQPIRSALNAEPLDLSPLNLASHRPLLGIDKVLIEAGKHDLFCSRESLAELQKAWGHPETWLVNHGHISMLVAPLIIGRTCQWLAGALNSPKPKALSRFG